MSLTVGPGYACFEALYEYVPREQGEIELQIGDLCYVQKPIPDAQGWLEGENMRSRISGQFPGTYCKVVDSNAAPPRPKKPTPGAKPPPSQKMDIQSMEINGHPVEKIYVIKPIWCILCEEYIWGGGRISLICSGCLLCAHSGCHQLFSSIKCNDVKEKMTPKEDIVKPLNDWTPEEVLEWMVAARLHPYIPHIRKDNLAGKDLVKVNENYLKQCGITFDLHIKLFQLCIEELLKPPPTNEQLAAALPLNETCDIKTHTKLHDHTFTTQQKCNICEKPMWGIFRQGIMCAICGMQCHRPCAFAMKNRECTGVNNTARRSSVSEDPSFCCNFTTPDIPPVMRKCVEAVEKNGISTREVYTKGVPYDLYQHLKAALNQNPEHVNMYDNYWNDPGCAAHVLKAFLLELPMPLLHTDQYDALIYTVDSEDSSPGTIQQYWEKLPPANQSHLGHLLKHLLKLCNNSDVNGLTFVEMSRIFSYLIVRPPDNEASKFVKNMDLHEKVVLALLTSYDCWQNPSNYRRVSAADIREPESEPGSAFESGDWLWSDGSRRDVFQRLLGTPDGTFLVRPSEARRGEWTLTVRKEGKDRLIKIISRDGLFGFREDLLKFQSIKDLVFHFRDNSLKDYNEKLDVKLKYPCTQKSKLKVKDQEALKKRFEEISAKLKDIKVTELRAEELCQQCEECKSLCESQTDVVNFIEEQILLAEKQSKEVCVQERNDLMKSKKFLDQLLAEEKNIWTELDSQLHSLSHESNRLKAKLTELSTELPALREEYNELEPNMDPKDITKDDEPELYDQVPTSVVTQVSQTSSNDLPEQSWLFQNLDKSRIKAMLENKPDGTFLVRNSLNFPYAISLVHDGQIKNIPILKGPNGFGFAEPHNTYKTLHALINHYHNQSLRLHNRNLDTTLRIPYKFLEHTGDEPIYDVMSAYI